MVRSGYPVKEIQAKMDEMVEKDSEFIRKCAHGKSTENFPIGTVTAAGKGAAMPKLA